MLPHSPPLPLVIDYSNKYHDITAEREKGGILALEQRDRVRRVRLMHPIWDNSMKLIFPRTVASNREPGGRL